MKKKFKLMLMVVFTPQSKSSPVERRRRAILSALGHDEDSDCSITIGGIGYHILRGDAVGMEHFPTPVPDDGIVVFDYFAEDKIPGAISGVEISEAISDLIELGIVTAPTCNCTFSVRVTESDI